MCYLQTTNLSLQVVSTYEQHKERDRIRKRAERSSMSTQERAAARARNVQQQQRLRSNLTDQERAEARTRNVEEQQRLRSNLTDQERAEARARNVEEQQRSRANETEERRTQRMERDLQWHQDQRDAEPPRPRGRRANQVILLKGAFEYDVNTFNLHEHKVRLCNIEWFSFTMSSPF